MFTKISILIYIGSPIDCARYRHTALYLEHANGKTALMHILGGHGFFKYTEHSDYIIPETGPENDLAGRILVAEFADSISSSTNTALLKSAIMSTPINHEDPEWNCQNWVSDALARLVERGYISSSQRERGCDGMIDVCLEAVDEE